MYRNHVILQKRRSRPSARNVRKSDTRTASGKVRSAPGSLGNIADFVIDVRSRGLDGLVLQGEFARNPRHGICEGVPGGNSLPPQVHNQGNPGSAGQSRSVNAMLFVDGWLSHGGHTSVYGPRPAALKKCGVNVNTAQSVLTSGPIRSVMVTMVFRFYPAQDHFCACPRLERGVKYRWFYQK